MGMARKLREEVAGGVQHVYARGNDRRARSSSARQIACCISASLAGRSPAPRWRCLAYCLMDNHVHLARRDAEAEPGVRDAAAARALRADAQSSGTDAAGTCSRGASARAGPRRHGSCGRVVRYIALNPVRPGSASRDARLALEQPSRRRSAATGPGCGWMSTACSRTSLSDGGEPLARYRELVG